MCAESLRDPDPGRLRVSSRTLQLVAIDLDGTLIDSVGELHQGVNRMLEELSMPGVSEASVRAWVGNGMDRLVHRALTGQMQLDAEPQLHARAMFAFRNAYAAILGSAARLYPGVEDGLRWLHEQQLPLVVVTNKDAHFARCLLQRLNVDHYFSHLIGGDDVRARKPDPEGLLRAAELCSAQAANSLLIGDSVSDFRAARAAGFDCVGMSYGYNHGQAVVSLPADEAPDAVLDSFLGLPALLS